MNILITPTSDRHMAMVLCEAWMRRQNLLFDRWIVADGGKKPTRLTMGQEQLRVPWQEKGNVSLACNLNEALKALGSVKDTDKLFIVEDDDYYRPNHLDVNSSSLENADIAGCRWLHYYNLRVKGWRTIQNGCSALCNTAFRGSAVPALKHAIQKALELDSYHVDRFFWQTNGLRKNLHNKITVIGMKGLPGRRGIGIGHNERAAWNKDPDAVRLRSWLGTDAARYTKL